MTEKKIIKKMKIKKSHNFPLAGACAAGLLLVSGMATTSVPDAATIRFIKQHLAEPGHTWASYQGVAEGLASTNREVRFFAVQAGLQLEVFRAEALAVALRDDDPGILNLGLAALEREYRGQYSPRLVEIVLSGRAACLPALRLLLKNDLPHVALSFESLFRRGGVPVRECLLDEVQRGRIVMSAPALLSLCDVMGVRERVTVLSHLASRGQEGLFADEFARWSSDAQRVFAEAVRSRPGLAAEPALVRLLGRFRDPSFEQTLRAAMITAGNSGFRQRLAEELMGARDMAAARAAADAVLSLGERKDPASEYARAVVLIDRYAMGERILETWTGQRLRSLSELAAHLREGTSTGAVRTIGRLQDGARALQRMGREQDALREEVRRYLRSPDSILLKRNLAAFLASMQLAL